MKKGWEKKSVGEVCEFQRGLTYAKGDEVESSRNVVLRANNIDLATNLLDFSELKYISDEIAVSENKKVRKDTLMICTASGSKSHLGKVALIDDDYGYAFGGFMGLLKPKNGILAGYLFHLMTSDDYKDFIAALSDGANINNLKFDQLKSFVVPLAPLLEQQRIVGLLDEAFAGLATAQAHAEKNLQNARALFESHLQSVFTQRGKRWVEAVIGDCIRFIDYRGKTPVKTVSGIRLITAKNVKMGYLQESPMEFIASEGYKSWMTRGIPEKGDVLFTTEAPLANVAQLDTDAKVAFAQRIIIMQSDAARLDSTFLKYLLLSQPVQQRIRTKGTGATVQGTIWFEDSKRELVTRYLQSGEAREYLPALEATDALIDGFQSPLGMEVLATVDWLVTNERAEPTLAGVSASLRRWPSDSSAVERKVRIFDDRLLDLALKRLKESGAVE